MRLYYLAILVLITNCLGIFSSQKSDNEFKSKVIKFYSLLFQNEKVTVEQTVHLFGSIAVEDEEYLFFEDCEKLKSPKDCDAQYDAQYALCIDKYGKLIEGTKCKSVMFKYFLQKKQELTYGRSYQEIIGLIRQSSTYKDNIILELVFDNDNKVYFRASLDDGYGLVLGDIYLSNKESVFNSMPGSNPRYLELKYK